MNRNVKKIVKTFLITFLLLFLFHLIYSYLNDSNSIGGATVYRPDYYQMSVKNYASKEYKSSQLSTVDQKYEKIADISTRTGSFDSDEQKAKACIEQCNSLVQLEQKSGNNGHRQLTLSIGVPPENFEELYNQLTKIGRVKSKKITKNDKTNEYNELNAKKRSLEKIRESLLELKSKNGRIEEYIKLQNRILEVESQLQDLGMSLGDFDSKKEFCTVKFSLVENKFYTIFLQKVKISLEWTVKIYLQFMFALLFLTLSAYCLVSLFDKIKLFDKK